MLSGETVLRDLVQVDGFIFFQDDNRILGYNLQLQAYARFIRKIGAIPVLDSNMVNFLQALLDQLHKITEFETFREETERERDLHGRDVAFVLACAYCGKGAFPSGVQLMAHLFNDPHDQVRKKNRFKKLHGPMTQDLVAFLEREKHILTRHHFRETLLEPLVDFYFLTKSFLSQTSRYLEALEKQEQQPSSSVGRSVDEILGYVVELIDRAHCIESVPHCSTVLFQYPTYGVAYTCNNIVFVSIACYVVNCKLTSFLPDRRQRLSGVLAQNPETTSPDSGQHLFSASSATDITSEPDVCRSKLTHGQQQIANATATVRGRSTAIPNNGTANYPSNVGDSTLCHVSSSPDDHVSPADAFPDANTLATDADERVLNATARSPPSSNVVQPVDATTNTAVASISDVPARTTPGIPTPDAAVSRLPSGAGW